jgi:O-antigen ligase
VIGLGLVAAAAAAIAFSLNPGSWERVTQTDPTSGTGRVDIWNVAWNVFKDHPVSGVGLNNFGRVAGDYVREVGPLEDVDLVVKAPDRSVHNSYLQFLAENGVVGLVLFAFVALGCLRAAMSAARSFAELARPELVAVAHGLFVGSVGLLASYFFISGSVARPLWILLGLCLASVEVARGLAERSPLSGSRLP